MGEEHKEKALLQYISREYLQRLQDKITDILSTSLIMVDENGNPLTDSSNPLAYCDRMRRDPEKGETCLTSTMELVRQVRETGEIVIGKCPHTGHAIAAVPILLDGTPLAYWIVGHVHLAESDEELYLPDTMLVDSESLGYQVPYLRRAALGYLLNFLKIMAEEILYLMAYNSVFREKNAQLFALSEKTQHTMDAMRTFMNATDVIVYVTDYYTGEILMCNDSYARFFGGDTDELIGGYCFHGLGYNTFCPFCPRNKIVDENMQPTEPVHWENHLDKFSMWLQNTNSAAYWVDGRLVHVATCLNITPRKQLEQEVNQLAYWDRLLYIPNSVCLERDLKLGGPYECMVVIDIQGLRKINDIYGRLCGDQLLMAVRDYLLGLNIPGAAIYRMEIADFGILMPPSAEPELPKAIAERIVERCQHPWVPKMGGEDSEIYISVNICVVPVEDDDASLHTMYSAIEHTLEIARNTGVVAIYDDYVERRFYTRLKLEISLKNAVRENMKGFYLMFQPLVDPGVSLWRGVEALCRWKSPDLGEISPGEFIPVAESIGLIGTIGIWVLEAAIKQVKEWQLDLVDQFLLEVNLSPVQLSILNIDKTIVGILERYDYPPDKLCLEITESNEFNFSKHNTEAIERMHKIGIVIALDDFGTGYASFNSLHKLPAQILKTDRSFINGMETDSFLQRLFHVMVELAHASNMKIVAEGVETDFQAKFLFQQGTDFFQGYLFSRPLSAEQLAENMSNFYVPPKSLAGMNYSQMDISEIGGYAPYELGSSLGKMLNRCMQELFGSTDIMASIDWVLAYVGENLRVSRAYVFARQPGGTFTNTNEWCAPGIIREKDDMQNADIDKDSPGWTGALRRDGMIVASDVRTLEPNVRDALITQGIKSIVEYAIWNENELFGFVGFDDCVSIRNWTKEELHMLYSLAGNISSTLQNHRLREEVQQHSNISINVLDNMKTIIYVSDLETDEILFASRRMLEAYKDRRLTGRICWEALQDRSDRCEFCPLPRLGDKPGETVEWELYNEILGRHFRVRDSIIPWGDKMAHLSYSEDITELKLYQGKLEVYASTDMMTATLNRGAFNASLRDMLDTANAMGVPVSIVFIDIDNLKQENDSNGHTAGDTMISAVVQSLRSSIRDRDILGRYGGDEFVIAMMRCTKDIAARRMEDARDRLDNINRTSHCDYSFSYGVAESDEQPYEKSPAYIQRLLEIADQRMFEQKKQNKNRLGLSN